MTSINTNVAAMTALRTLSQINNDLLTTQNRISTGLRVSSAADNAAYWSIATTMRSDLKAHSAVKDALGLGSAKVDVASTAMDSSIEIADEIKAKLVAARQPGVDRAKIQKEISELQNQLGSIADSASFSGQNWVSVNSGAANYNANKSLVSSFNRQNGSVSVGTIGVNISDIKLFDSNDQSGILDRDMTYTDNNGAARTVTGASVTSIDISALTDSDADLATLESYIAGVDASINAMTDGAATLGSVKKRIGIQSKFVTNLMDAIKTGIGRLVDADLTEEATKLQALQVRQQLAVQSLSIANSSSQNILQLFR